MKKKLDQDLKNYVGSFVTMEWIAGYDVAKIVGLKRTRKEFRIRKLSKPKILKGVAYPYFIETVEVDCDTGKVTLFEKPWGLAPTEEKAKETAKEFCELFDTEQIKLQKKGQDLEDELLWKNSEAELRQISRQDLKDVSKSRQIILRGNFPSLFAVMAAHTGKLDKVFHESCRRAWLLDYARLTGNVLDPALSSDPDFYARLYSAIRNYRRRKESTKRRHSIDEELARGWICEKYCNLSSQKLAERMSKKFGRTVTKNQIFALKVRRLNKLSLCSNVREGAPTKMV